MADLFESAQLFEASAKLQSASTWLRQASVHESVAGTGAAELEWAGHFLSRLDPATLSARCPQVGDHLAVQATSARPTYYASLLKLRRQLQEADLATPEALTKFLVAVFEVLMSGGRDLAKLTKAERELAADFLKEVSLGLLAQLDHNGLPTSYPYIVPEIAYHGTPG